MENTEGIFDSKKGRLRRVVFKYRMGYVAPRNKIRSNGGRNTVTDLRATNKERFPCNGC